MVFLVKLLELSKKQNLSTMTAKPTKKVNKKRVDLISIMLRDINELKSDKHASTGSKLCEDCQLLAAYALWIFIPTFWIILSGSLWDFSGFQPETISAINVLVNFLTLFHSLVFDKIRQYCILIDIYCSHFGWNYRNEETEAGDTTSAGLCVKGGFAFLKFSVLWTMKQLWMTWIQCEKSAPARVTYIQHAPTICDYDVPIFILF